LEHVLERLLLARSRISSRWNQCPLAELPKRNHQDALAVALENYFLAPFTAALSVAPALNAGALEALIFIAAPVDGLRPCASIKKEW
jgi:hypothetical protein